ncbi:MAG: NUDIX domain-containing protein [Sphaerochaeta sp.]
MDERITTAGILVQDGKYLIAKREAKGAIGGLWEFPGGKNRYTEREEETLEREFMEELSLPVTVGKLVHTHDFINKDTVYHLKAYMVSTDSLDAITLSVHTEWRLVSLEALGMYTFAPSDAEIIETLLGLQG